MALVIGIIVVAAGAVLVWGVDRTVSGVETSTIGVILMAVGGMGVLASLLLSAKRTTPDSETDERRDSLSPVSEEARPGEETSPFGRGWPRQPPSP
jgi:hypothetical protein